MTELEGLKSRNFDFIIHSHVLEHIPCDEAYTLFHLHRALKEDGRHIFVVPFVKGSYDCTFAEIGRVERERRFVQWDHVRRFGLEDISQTLGKLIELSYDFNAEDILPKEELERIRLPKYTWKGLSVFTVIDLGRYDMKLLDSSRVNT